MRQSAPFYSTRSGNSKLSSFLWIGRFIDLFRRIYYPCTYIALEGGGGGGDSNVTRTGMFGVNSEENLHEIPARSLRRLFHFLKLKNVVIFLKITICLLLSRPARSYFVSELLKFFSTPKRYRS